MIARDPQLIAKFAYILEHFPEVVEFLDAWADDELRSLPSNTGNVAVAQGRCQALRELADTFIKAPATVESLRARPITHTVRSV